jgi:hypothetical protein
VAAAVLLQISEQSQGRIKRRVTFPIVGHDYTVTLVTSELRVKGGEGITLVTKELRVKGGEGSHYYVDWYFINGKSQHGHSTSQPPRIFKGMFRDFEPYEPFNAEIKSFRATLSDEIFFIGDFAS